MTDVNTLHPRLSWSRLATLPMRKTTKPMSNQNDASGSYTSIEIKYVVNTIVNLAKIIDMIISTNAFS
jgi:hypothetical protein